MPRKTKQQKMAAELRALRHQAVKGAVVPTSVQNSYSNTDSKSRVASLMTNVTSNTEMRSSVTEYSHIIKDLRKVAILATIALLIEVVLSLTLNFGFAKLIPGSS